MMLPDYLPILCLQTCAGDRQKKLLVETISEKLTEKNVRITTVSRWPLFAEKALEEKEIVRLISRCDLLVVDGQSCPGRASLLLGDHPCPVQEDGGGYPHFSCPSLSQTAVCAQSIFEWLVDCQKNTPLWGCVLIGGRSSRMGQPKHLIVGRSGASWLEQSCAVLSSRVRRVVISGGGAIPQAIGSFTRIDDLPGLCGPMAGISAAMKQYPFVSWLVLACDMPDITPESISWLVEQPRPGRCAVIPRNPQTGKVEPLYGWYDFRSAPRFEFLAAKGDMRMTSLASCPGVYTPTIPENLVGSWRNVNRPEELSG
jgi:molybdopterin-guanine dinucleotide biosynthesis protein A